MKHENKRYVSLDIIRSLAILLVIVVHAGELIYYEQGAIGFLELNQSERIEFLSFFTIGRIGVPLFFFLTGYLMLDRPNLENNFYKKRFMPLYITSLLGITMLVIYDVVIHHVPFQFSMYIQELLMLSDLPGIQTWYIPVILAIYSFLPFASKGVKDLSPKTLMWCLVVASFYLFFLREINIILVNSDTAPFYPYIDFGFVTAFGVYFLLGWVIKQGIFDKIPSVLLLLIGVLSLWGLIDLQNYSFSVGLNYLIWYDSGLLLVTSVCIFTLLLRLPDSIFTGSIFRWISISSFGIFWIHSMVQDQLYPIVRSFDTKLIQTFILILTNFILSFVIVLIYRKIKKLIMNR